ncbi:MarR family winged helix-turn-helix transcriptional regulator [Acidaminobacter sp. JC074]|uniref:MarR family winged helix-turn-helix transcriptional regulator n=1 Tax=Acidaminobacter sp. JC074 TaxID=2530199 RepID=UPI001F0F05F7|nr:MarR family transcriptional regulator [Acidaminobacter sp. JC074]
MDLNLKLMIVLGKLSRVFLDRLSKNLESLDMPISAYPMLAHLNDVGRAKTQKLGEVAFITSGSITHMINKLIKQNWVRKVVDAEDKRITWIEMTDEGQRIFDQVHKTHMAYLDGLLEDFTDEEKIMFINQIKYFGKTIEEK